LILGKGRSERLKDDFGWHVYFNSGEREERDCGRMKDDFGCLILILILWKGRSGRIKDNFGKTTLFVVLILILWKGRSGTVEE
jgi:hypothetical protein